MPRANGNDLCELFGFAPDDKTDVARKQWKSQECPFIAGTCIKHSHPQADGRMVIYGSCSVANKTRSGTEEIVLCPQRLYADDYLTLKTCVQDAAGKPITVLHARQYSALKRQGKLPTEVTVLLGHNSGREISVTNPDIISLSLDWVIAHVKNQKLCAIYPCEVQSIDTTGNYHANWTAYAEEKNKVPDSRHGMNWANVWKRLIPQLILKGSVAATSKLCVAGLFFVVPDRVYKQFEKIVGEVPKVRTAGAGVISVMTYGIGPLVPFGKIRQLEQLRTVRMNVADFAAAFASGQQVRLGPQLDMKVSEILDSL